MTDPRIPSTVIDSAGSALGLCVLLSSLGCQNNTIELEFPPNGTSGMPPATDDGSTSAEASTSDQPITTTITTTSTTTSTTAPPPPPPTATATTGVPPGNEACLGYAQIISACYGDYYEDVYLGCIEALEFVITNYGEACGLLYEEYLACLSSLSCRELMTGIVMCQEQLDLFELECL